MLASDTSVEVVKPRNTRSLLDSDSLIADLWRSKIG